MSPRVSVLIPCRNTARFLRDTVESVLGQTFGDFELVMLDDGSTDETATLLKELQRRDPRIRTWSRERRGLVDTRNELLRQAQGDFLSWHDSDDLMAPKRLALQLAAFENEPKLVWVGGACTLIDPEGLPIRTHVFPSDHDTLCQMMLQEIACFFGSTLMRREVVVKLGGFRHPFVLSEDFDLCVRMSEVGRVTNLSQVVLYYRQHMGSTVNAARPQSFVYSRLVRELAAERRTLGSDRLERGEQVELDFSGLPTPRQNQLETQRRWGWWALGAGHLKTARKHAIQAVRLAPHHLESWRLFACAMRGR